MSRKRDKPWMVSKSKLLGWGKGMLPTSDSVTTGACTPVSSRKWLVWTVLNNDSSRHGIKPH